MLRGGHAYDLETLLGAAIGHYYRTMFPRTRMGDCTEQEKERVTKYIDEHLDDWRTKLAREWPRPEDPKQVEPKGVMERVYAFWNSDLRTHLDGFMDEPGSDDKRLLPDILMDWATTKLPADRDDPRAVLATAFASAVDEAHVYFKVPSSIKDLVDAHIRIL